MPVDKLVSYFVGLSRTQKRIIALTIDTLLLSLAFAAALYVRLFEQFTENWAEYVWFIAAAPVLAVPVFVRFGLYRAILRYMGREAFATVFNAVTLSALIMALVVFFASRSVDLLIPRSTVINYWLMALLAVGGSRYLARHILFKGVLPLPFLRERRQSKLYSKAVPVAIYGAGAAGFQLFEALRDRASLRPVAFVDDDPSLQRQAIAGLKVYSPENVEQMIRETGAVELLLAIPSLSRRQRGQLLSVLEPYPLHVRTIPSIEQLASGILKVDDLAEVELSDILHRDEVTPREDLLEECISNKAVLVTGAGGSIGSELCRQIIKLRPSSLVLIEHSEFNLYAIHEELLNQLRIQGDRFPIVPILCSIKNTSQLHAAMNAYHVDTVYHAAAYKHVPIVEHNIAEGLNNNVIGTLSSAQAAIAAGVSNFVLISTDKAVRPTNVMGASKRLAEMALQALGSESELVFFNGESFLPRGAAGQTVRNSTRFTMVRFGNVLGSSGSVIPKFREQIQNGGPVTVTHPNITRYFMTIPEAAQLVIQAGSMGQGGDVFVLDMGEPVKILDLATKMIHLHGLSVCDDQNQDGDIVIEFTGLRPGEKLYEELLIGDNPSPTEHPMIMRAQEEFISWEKMKKVLARLCADLSSTNYKDVRQILSEYVKGYQPQGEIVDWIHTASSQTPESTGQVIDFADEAKRLQKGDWI